jgi:hypothetical protein
MTEVEQPLSKVSFDNNADLLVFRDRHEYRTRSRVGYIVFGLMCVGLCAFLCLQIVIPLLKMAAAYPDDRTFEYVVAAVCLTFACLVLMFAVWCFRANPWVVVNAAGIVFRNRSRLLVRRARDLLVEFGDVYEVDTESKVDKGGRFDTEPIGRVYWLKIYSDGSGNLRLPWSTSQRDVAVRFGDTFLASMQEMATRSGGGAVPEPITEGAHDGQG